MSERRSPGFYWVHLEHARRPWWVCFWTGEHWEVPRDTRRHQDRDFTEIGPNVLEPKLNRP